MIYESFYLYAKFTLKKKTQIYTKGLSFIISKQGGNLLRMLISMLCSKCFRNNIQHYIIELLFLNKSIT